MIIRFARHGQPALTGLPPGTNYEFPPMDRELSVLGVEQAHRLGCHLKNEGFHGRIISSPLVRTVTTSEIIAEECDLTFYLEPRMQEMRIYTAPYMGLTIEEIRKAFPRLAADATLPFPWTVEDPNEQVEQVSIRVNELVEELLATPPADDILLIGHGATLGALKRFFFNRSGEVIDTAYYWNCALSRYDVAPDGSAVMVELARYDFMPDEMVTSNKRHLTDPPEK